MARAIDSEAAYRFLSEQLVKETGAFSKGVNKGLNIARSAMRNPDAIPTLRPVSRERIEEAWRGGWIAVRESEIAGFNPEFAGHYSLGGYKCSRCKAEAVLDCNDEFVLDNFCPRCGAAMTDEAVQMVMERLETLNEED